MSQKELSKFLSYVLRHRPDAIGIELVQSLRYTLLSHDPASSLTKLRSKFL